MNALILLEKKNADMIPNSKPVLQKPYKIIVTNNSFSVSRQITLYSDNGTVIKRTLIRTLSYLIS